MVSKAVDRIAAEDTRSFSVRMLTVKDRNWVAQFLDDHWHSTKVVSRGNVYYAHLLPGFLAVPKPDHNAAATAKPCGLITYRSDGAECEIVTLDSLQSNVGIGTALLESVRTIASEQGCKRLWVITTNDNLNALRFYQKRGFRITAVYPNAMAEARRLKPQIPLIGRNQIPLRDEIELSIDL